jgi:hypothetical protein
VSVRDTGVGIAAEHLPRLFEMFSQAEPALERSQGGLGIGLALVRELVELHGGTVEACSGGIGMGSEFTVRLPIAEGPVDRLQEPSHDEKQEARSVRQRRIRQERLDQLGRLDPNAVLPDRDPVWHAPLIREAEQNGNSFAAIWHLDRLIAARPEDWFLYARRGRAWSLSDQLDTISRKPSGSARATRSSTSRLTVCSIAPKPSAGPRPCGISTA